MSIFIDKSTKLVVQGITGRDGSFHTKQMIAYGTNVIAGVTPGKRGQKFENTVPIFNTVHDAVSATGADTTVIYVPLRAPPTQSWKLRTRESNWWCVSRKGSPCWI